MSGGLSIAARRRVQRVVDDLVSDELVYEVLDGCSGRRDDIAFGTVRELLDHIVEVAYVRGRVHRRRARASRGG